MVSRPFEVRFTAPVGTSVISASCTANFSLIVAGAVDRQLHALGQDGKSIWDTRLDHEVWATAISADGTRIAAGTANKNPSDGTVYVFNSNKKALWQKKIGAPVWGVALSANGSVLAVTAWDGNLYLFREKKGEWALVGKEAISQSGAYGISISDDGSVIAVVAYEEGLHFYDSNLKKLGEIKNNNFGYRAALTRDGKVVIAGLRNGEVSLSERLGRKRTKSVKLSQRPICGVAITPNAKLCVAGGFDGHVHVLNEALESLWTYRTEGEVWAVDVSDDGRFICVASGDGKVYALENKITTAALEELGHLESKIESAEEWDEKNDLLTRLAEQYADYGLVEYGLAKLKKWRDEDVVDDTSMYTGSSKILETVIDKEVADYRAQFLLAQLYESRREHWRAAVSFSIAAKDANLRQRAFVSAARCFAKANHNSAAWSCLRRAKEQSLHEEDLRVLYNLARSLEDVGNLASARLYYDILLTWEPRYRDVARRAQSIDEGQTESDAGRLGEVDYTGLTVNLLGSDAPRFNQVDPSLHRVMQARARELHVSDSERARFEAVFKKYYAGPDGIREKTKNDLGYDVESYIKYDFLLPEDEIKKELERLNTLALLEGNEKVTRSLDIGAATGRWPRTFASQGIEAYGIDIEEKAIEYAERKLTAADRERGFPDLRVANALALPFEDGMFCLATCMMGTFSHIAKSDHLKFFSECRRVLRQDGLLLISTWDVECRHQSYLSMYTVAEKQKIDENSLTRQQLWNLTNSEGFDVQAQVPICLIPDVLSFELGIKELDAEALREMWSIDLAARSNFPEMHGEMFLTLARRR